MAEYKSIQDITDPNELKVMAFDLQVQAQQAQQQLQLVLQRLGELQNENNTTQQKR